jgi:hypothetical protein
VQGVDQDKRPYSEVIVTIPPKRVVSLTWEYTVTQAARPDGKGLRYLHYVEPQPMLNPQQIELRVVAPKGWKAQDLVGGWKATPNAAGVTFPAAERMLLKLRLTPPA